MHIFFSSMSTIDHCLYIYIYILLFFVPITYYCLYFLGQWQILTIGILDSDCQITYHSPSKKLLPPRYLLNTGGLDDSGFGLNKDLQTLWTVPTSVYEIDILPLCIIVWYAQWNLLNKCFLNLNLNKGANSIFDNCHSKVWANIAQETYATSSLNG